MSGFISIIVPAYQAGKFLPAGLKSIGAQTRSDWELILVEDGSADETRHLTHALAADHPGNRVVYHQHTTNLGVSAARNRAIELAQGNVFAFLDADDVWHPDHLEICTRMMEQHDAQFVISGFETIGSGASEGTPSPFPTEEQLRDPVPHLLRENFIQSSSTVMMSRLAWEQSGAFDESLRIGEDLDVWIRAIQRHGLVHTGKITCHYTRHAGSAMADTMKVCRDRIRFLQKQVRLMPPQGRLLHSLLSAAYWNLLRFSWRRSPGDGLRCAALALSHSLRARIHPPKS